MIDVSNNPNARETLLTIIKNHGQCYCHENDCPIYDMCLFLKRKYRYFHSVSSKRFTYCLELYIELYGERALKDDLIEAML